MSAEYSVEEVRACLAEFSADVAFPREEIDIEKARKMLTAYAKRIEADESAVPKFWITTDDLARASHEKPDWCDNVVACPHIESAPEKAVFLYIHPPAQAAQVGCSTCGGENITYTNHPHSPDAADSGRVTEVMVERAFQAMDAVFAVEFPDRSVLGAAEKSLACKGIRAALEAALAGVPDGWEFRWHTDGDDSLLLISHPLHGGVGVYKNPTSKRIIPEEMLYRLGCDLLAAAPSATPEGGEVK